jgi:hypothetical protein
VFADREKLVRPATTHDDRRLGVRSADLVDTGPERGVDPALAARLDGIGLQTNLTSDAGAWGVMQIIPSAWTTSRTS